MRKVIFTTCGTSLLESGCWSAPPVQQIPRDDDLRIMEVLIKNKPMNKDYLDHSPEKFTLRKEVKDNPGMYIRDLPAELATLVILNGALRESDKDRIGEGDSIFLLHSSNEYGPACAQVLKKIIKENNMVPGCEIKAEPFPELDPLNPQAFADGMNRMWQFCFDKMREHNDPSTHFYFNLTGGYKAMGFTLSALCLSMVAHFPNTRIIYLHESAGTNLVNIQMNLSGPVPTPMIDVKKPKINKADLIGQL